MTHVELSIERLAIDGFDLSPREARAAGRAVEAELTRLLATGDLPPRLARGGAVGRLSRRPLEIGTWSDPGDLGAQVARALFTGLGGAAR